LLTLIRKINKNYRFSVAKCRLSPFFLEILAYDMAADSSRKVFLKSALAGALGFFLLSRFRPEGRPASRERSSARLPQARREERAVSRDNPFA